MTEAYVKVPLNDFVMECAARLRRWNEGGQLSDVKRCLWDEFLDYTESVCRDGCHTVRGWVDNWLMNGDFFERNQVAKEMGFDDPEDFDDDAWYAWCDKNEVSGRNDLYAFRY